MSDWESDIEASFAETAALYGIQKRKIFRKKQRAYARSIVKTLSIPTNYVGLVIGSGGNTIKKLRTKSDAQIIIDDSTGIETKITLRGTNSAINKAKQMIQKIVNRTSKQSQINQNKDSNAAPEPILENPFIL